MQRTASVRESRALRLTACVLALVVLSLRVASPYLHNHSALDSSAAHAAMHAACASCDAEATPALDDAATPVLPAASVVISLHLIERPLTQNQSLSQRLDIGRAPPALIA